MKASHWRMGFGEVSIQRTWKCVQTARQVCVIAFIEWWRSMSQMWLWRFTNQVHMIKVPSQLGMYPGSYLDAPPAGYHLYGESHSSPECPPHWVNQLLQGDNSDLEVDQEPAVEVEATGEKVLTAWDLTYSRATVTCEWDYPRERCQSYPTTTALLLTKHMWLLSIDGQAHALDELELEGGVM